MVFSYSFDSAIRLTLDEAQGKAQEYVLFVSTIASLLEHCASTPFRRFVANTLPPTPGPFTNTHAPSLLYTHEIPFSPASSSPSSSFSFSLHLPYVLSLSIYLSIYLLIGITRLRPLSYKKEAFPTSLISTTRCDR